MKKELITWSLVVLGWLVSNTIAYRYGLREANASTAESLFLEISLLVETTQRVYSDIVSSLSRKDPAEVRLPMWADLERVRNQYFNNKSRYNYMLAKYFNEEIRSGVMKMLRDMQLDYPECRYRAERGEGLLDPLVPFIEYWDGDYVAAEPQNGLKWAMANMLASNKTKHWEAKDRVLPSP